MTHKVNENYLPTARLEENKKRTCSRWREIVCRSGEFSCLRLRPAEIRFDGGSHDVIICCSPNFWRMTKVHTERGTKSICSMPPYKPPVHRYGQSHWPIRWISPLSLWPYSFKFLILFRRLSVHIPFLHGTLPLHLSVKVRDQEKVFWFFFTTLLLSGGGGCPLHLHSVRPKLRPHSSSNCFLAAGHFSNGNCSRPGFDIISRWMSHRRLRSTNLWNKTSRQKQKKMGMSFIPADATIGTSQWWRPWATPPRSRVSVPAIPVAISPAPLTTFPEFSSQKKSETSSFPSRWLFEFASSIKEAVTNELIVSSQAHKK